MTATTTPTVFTFNETRSVPGVSFGRLMAVEARKLVNTRAGRWVIAISVLLSVLSVASGVALIPRGSLQALFSLAVTPVGLLMPVVAVLSATAEWAQRTGLVTFALEPRRGRVVAAKLVVSVAAGLAAVATALAVSAAAVVVASVSGAGGSFHLEVSVVAGSAVIVTAAMLQASAYGFLLLNTPAAIVALFVLPAAWSLATTLSPWLSERAHWLDTGAAGLPFLTGDFTAIGWLHLASAAAIWIMLPLSLGVGRVLRAEIK